MKGKRLISLFLSAVMLLSCIAGLDFSAYSATLASSGYCGNGSNVKYTFDSSTGKLVISGTGAMRDYSSSSSPFCEQSSIKTIVINSGVTSIGDYAFDECKGLTSVTIPNSVTSIGRCAFSGCTGLTSVTIPNSVKSISAWAFSVCTGLTSVTIPNSVTYIGEYAFDYCTGLTSVTIGNGVKSIGEWAFYECTGLTKVNIKSIDAWYNISFESYVSNPLYYAHNLFLNDELVTELDIPNSVKSIGNYAFEECTGLTSVTIPNSVTSIGYHAFEGCTGLTSVTIPNSVTTIGSSAFYGCTGLTDIYYLDTQSKWNNISIGADAIPSTATIHYHDHVYLIIESVQPTCTADGYIRYRCNDCGTEYVEIKPIRHTAGATLAQDTVSIDGIDYIYENAVYCTVCHEMTDGTLVRKAGSCGENVAYDLDLKTGELVISGTGAMTAYAEKASPFYNDSTIKSVVFEDGVTAIGKYSFNNCAQLTDITIPTTVTAIGYAAFKSCSSLDNVVIPNSVTSIKSYAFNGCTGITNITMPFSLIISDATSFGLCDNIEVVNLTKGTGTIRNHTTTYTYCPWNISQHISTINFADDIKGIGAYAFCGIKDGVVFNIPHSVATIGENAFGGNTTALTINYHGTRAMWDNMYTFAGMDVTFNEIHSYELTDTVQPTCTVDGYNGYYCADCGDSYTLTFDALGHEFAVSAQDGVMTYSCTRCDALITQQVADVCATWSNDLLNTSAIDHPLLDVVPDGVLNAKDYALLKHIQKYGK